MECIFKWDSSEKQIERDQNLFAHRFSNVWVLSVKKSWGLWEHLRQRYEKMVFFSDKLESFMVYWTSKCIHYERNSFGNLLNTYMLIVCSSLQHFDHNQSQFIQKQRKKRRNLSPRISSELLIMCWTHWWIDSSIIWK